MMSASSITRLSEKRLGGRKPQLIHWQGKGLKQDTEKFRYRQEDPRGDHPYHRYESEGCQLCRPSRSPGNGTTAIARSNSDRLPYAANEWSRVYQAGQTNSGLQGHTHRYDYRCRRTQRPLRGLKRWCDRFS